MGARARTQTAIETLTVNIDNIEAQLAALYQRLEEETLSYFKKLADDTGIPYQTLINLYLRECATTKKKPSMKWRATG